jgi:hypothetical protein
MRLSSNRYAGDCFKVRLGWARLSVQVSFVCGKATPQTPTVSAKPVDPLLASLPEGIDIDVLILPRRLGPEGEGLYDDSVLTLAKDLRAEGVSADYLHPAEDRRWIGEKSAVALVVEFVVGIGGNAGWAALYALFRREPEQKVRVRVARKKDFAAKQEKEWVEAEGPGEEVARSL